MKRANFNNELNNHEHVEIEIAYICDGKDICSDKIGCYKVARPGMDHCTHTTNPDHALNGACSYPEKEPTRFHLINDKNPKIRYWEGTLEINE